MAAYRRVYDSRHVQADCEEPGSAPELGNRVWAIFTCLLLVADLWAAWAAADHGTNICELVFLLEVDVLRTWLNFGLFVRFLTVVT